MYEPPTTEPPLTTSTPEGSTTSTSFTTSEKTTTLATKKKCSRIRMKLQVLNGHTMKPLPGATVQIQTKRMHRHSPSHIPVLKSEHITDANGEVVEYGTLNGVYSYRVFKTHKGDIFRVKFDERIRRAKDCEVNMKVMAEKQEQSLVITPCTCKGELKIINKNTKLPVRGACVAYHLQADC